MFLLDPGNVGAFIQVILIDLVLAGDNAVVVGMAAAGLSPHLRHKAIFWGIVGAALLRVLLAMCAVYLLAIVGLLLAGGFLLLWVAWKMLQDVRETSRVAARQVSAAVPASASGTVPAHATQTKRLGQAMSQIILADVSMSLDNVLAVAGAARDHTVALGFGLILSVALMGFAANFIARLLNRHHWITYVGLIMILIVALRMIMEGSNEIAHVAGIALPIPGFAPVHAVMH